MIIYSSHYSESTNTMLKYSNTNQNTLFIIKGIIQILIHPNTVFECTWIHIPNTNTPLPKVLENIPWGIISPSNIPKSVNTLAYFTYNFRC